MKPAYIEFSFIFKELSDPTRLQILDILADGELCACDILETFQITQPTLSYHMKILVEAGLVSPRKEGTWIKYSLINHQVDSLRQFLKQINSKSQ